MKIFIFVLLTVYWLLIASPAYAEDYVLPYPSYMPGHKLYRAEQLLDRVQEFWHFGDVSKFKYHLALADKKLVEAEILFGHEQFLLAVNAVRVSNYNLNRAGYYLKRAVKSGKRLNQKEELYRKALIKHLEVKALLSEELPVTVIWRDENKPSVELKLYEELHRGVLYETEL